MAIAKVTSGVTNVTPVWFCIDLIIDSLNLLSDNSSNLTIHSSLFTIF